MPEVEFGREVLIEAIEREQLEGLREFLKSKSHTQTSIATYRSNEVRTLPTSPAAYK